jgi:hypothetical protein
MNATDTTEKAAAPKPTTGTPAAPAVEQSPGCLPKGFGLDSLLTVEQFAAWQSCKLAWVRKRIRSLPGCICESREHVRFHPRTSLEKKLKTKISAP